MDSDFIVESELDGVHEYGNHPIHALRVAGQGMDILHPNGVVVQSWAWFSITGLMLADVKMNMDFQSKSLKGLKVLGGKWKVPSWVVYGLSIAAGLMMQFFWSAWKPQLKDGELRIHADLYGSAGLNDKPDLNQPQARMDNYLVIVGLLFLVETSDSLQFIFTSAPLLYLGRRSFGKYLPTELPVKGFADKIYDSLVSGAGFDHILCRYQAVSALARQRGIGNRNNSTEPVGRKDKRSR